VPVPAQVIIVEPAPAVVAEQPQATVQQALPPAAMLQTPPAPVVQMQPAAPQGHRANKLVGEAICDAKGEEIGYIHDLVINRKGEVVHVVLSYGGFLGMGSRRTSVPFRALELGKGRIVYRPTDGKPVEQQPRFSYRQLTPGKEHRISQLLQRQVSHSQGEEIGAIDDFIIGPEGQIREAILSVGDKRVAVPFQELRITGDDHIITELPRGTLEQRQAFRYE
jgi:sporulation protein YlmC with PRC-barrel domain